MFTLGLSMFRFCVCSCSSFLCLISACIFFICLYVVKCFPSMCLSMMFFPVSVDHLFILCLSVMILCCGYWWSFDLGVDVFFLIVCICLIFYIVLIFLFRVYVLCFYVVCMYPASVLYLCTRFLCCDYVIVLVFVYLIVLVSILCLLM